MADNVPMGMEFMRWQNAPSLTEGIANIASGKHPLLNALGILLADGKKPETEAGVAPPATPVANMTGIGIQPPNVYGQLPQLPTIGSATAPTATAPVATQQNYDEEIKNYWKGLKP